MLITCCHTSSCCRYRGALGWAHGQGVCLGLVGGLCLGAVQLVVFGCYASAVWLGAFLVQEEIIQAGQFITVSVCVSV